MPKFGTRSRANLESCHIDLQVIFNEVIKSFDCSVLAGFRDQIEQNSLYRKGFSKVPWPLSKHNKSPSMAADVAPYPYDAIDTARFRYFAGFVMGTAEQLLKQGKISHRVRWGGDWDSDTEVSDNKFNDLAHFELVIT